MLRNLSIKNYVLIDSLDIEFEEGFSTITGETGAGKSILIGALSLILGQRAEVTTLKDKSQKCVVEGIFNISKFKQDKFFNTHDLDYEDNTIIRREILPGGKSRAFINDTPVNLNILKEFGSRLVDIHSQHQNLLLGDLYFQLSVVDIFGRNEKLVNKYNVEYHEYKRIETVLEQTLEKAKKSSSDLDYMQFQYDQLENACLKENEETDLENELKLLEHSAEIRSTLNRATEMLELSDNSLLDNLKSVIVDLEKLKDFYHKSGELSERLNSCYIELKDIAGEIEILSGDTETDPERADIVRQRLDEIYTLMQKHNLTRTKDLLDLKDDLRKDIEKIADYDNDVKRQKKQLAEQEGLVRKLAHQLSIKRRSIFPELEKKVVTLLKKLGMPNARFSISCTDRKDLRENGIDDICFLFSANKKIEMQELARVASGGEMSRLMLCIKNLVSKAFTVPTVIFDEIDSGVSGDIADKVGDIMLDISKDIQVISITHLPQIAGKGMNHYVVFKDESKETAYTGIKLLTHEDRIIEIAKMLSGKKLTDAAYENAKQLIKN